MPRASEWSKLLANKYNAYKIISRYKENSSDDRIFSVTGGVLHFDP